MGNSPLLWGPNSTANNLQNAELLATGEIIKNNGLKNYITLGNFENVATTGWSLGTIGTLTNALPTGSPTFGSGASGNLSIAVVSSGQLSGNASLSLVSSAATTVGNMLASQAYSIDISDQAKTLRYSFNYKIQSGSVNVNLSGTSSNSFAVAVYDVTNASFIAVTPAFGMIQGTGVGNVTGTFQTNATTASLRFIVYNANATAGAATLYFDDFFMGPQGPISNGPVISDTQTFAGVWSSNGTPPTIGNGSVTAKYGRTGDRAQIRYDIQMGSTTAYGTGVYTFSVPPGLAIDTTKLANNIDVVGYATSQSGSSSFLFLGSPAYFSSNTISVQTQGAAVTSWGPNSPATFVSSNYMSVYFEVPILGWSSNSLLSTDASTRVVAAKYYASTNQAASTATPINFDTKVIDSLNVVTTGASWKFSAPVSGTYLVSVVLIPTAATATNYLVYKNGVNDSYLLGSNNTAEYSASTIIQLNSNDYIDIRPGSAITISGSAAPYVSSVSIHLLLGPASIAASDSVNARYYNSATAISGTLATIVWSTKDFDSSSTGTLATTGQYFIPSSGKYLINTLISLTAAAAAAVNPLDLQIQKNGVAISEVNRTNGTTQVSQVLQAADIISCIQGDIIQVQVSSGTTTPSIISGTSKNWISIAKVGN